MSTSVAMRSRISIRMFPHTSGRRHKQGNRKQRLANSSSLKQRENAEPKRSRRDSKRKGGSRGERNAAFRERGASKSA